MVLLMLLGACPTGQRRGG